VNPDHLEPVTHAENIRRGTGPLAENAAKTHCVHGHEFAGENLYVRPDGRRQCRACNAEHQRRHHARKEQADV
jgi:hypothetical protein